MTNATIILNEACNLFEQGLLKGTLHHEDCRVFLGIAGAAELTDARSSTGRHCLPYLVKYILKIN